MRAGARWSALSACVLGVLVGLTPVGAAEAAPGTCATTPLVAHRGLHTGGVTENTLGAVRGAAELGVGFEVDLRTTRDGRVVLMHDRSLRRTTNGRGLVEERSLAQIRSLRTDDGQRVPTLRQALLVLRDHPDVRAVLDLKALTASAQESVRADVLELGVVDRVSAISVRDGLLAQSREILPEVPGFRILRELPSQERAVGHGYVNVHASLLTDAWVAAMAEVGVPFNVRVTDDPADWERGLAYGTTWVMTDDVAGYQAWCAGG